MKLDSARQIIGQALARGRAPQGMWAGERRARVRCTPRQRKTLVKGALELGLRGPLGAYLDPVDFWVCRDLLAHDTDGNIIFRLILVEGEHKGAPTIEQQPEPRLMTALREETQSQK